VKTDIATIAKTLRTGMRKTVNHLSVLLRKIVPNFLINRKMAHKTPEQVDIETKAFILKTFCFILVLVTVLFSYSIVFIEQPLFTEAPADKAILAILSMAMAQIFTVVSLVLTGKSSTPPPPPMPINPCYGPQPMQGGYVPMSFTPNLNNPMGGFSIDPSSAWTPPPPPSGPPVLESDEERERMAQARHEAKNA